MRSEVVHGCCLVWGSPVTAQHARNKHLSLSEDRELWWSWVSFLFSLLNAEIFSLLDVRITGQSLSGQKYCIRWWMYWRPLNEINGPLRQFHAPGAVPIESSPYPYAVSSINFNIIPSSSILMWWWFQNVNLLIMRVTSWSPSFPFVVLPVVPVFVLFWKRERQRERERKTKFQSIIKNT